MKNIAKHGSCFCYINIHSKTDWLSTLLCSCDEYHSYFLFTYWNKLHIYTLSLRVYNYTDHFSWELVNLGWVWVIIFDQNLKLRLFWMYSLLGMPSQIKFEISISIRGYWLLHWLINEYSYSLTNIFVFCFVKKGFYCSYFIILKGK